MKERGKKVKVGNWKKTRWETRSKEVLAMVKKKVIYIRLIRQAFFFFCKPWLFG